MIHKRLVTGFLWLFVGVSMVYFIIDEITEGSALEQSKRASPGPSAQTPERRPGNRRQVAESQIVVYYFHGNSRCFSCVMMERLAKETLDNQFTSETDSGKVEWRSINRDEPENAHFTQKFELFAPSVIISEEQNGHVQRWKNLTQVWKLLRNRPAYMDYVSKEIKEYLGS